MSVAEIRLDGRVAIVTGAGRGLGQAYAESLASRGARVIVNDIGTSMAGQGTSEHEAASVVAGIIGRGGDAVVDTHDVSSAEGSCALVDSAVATYGRIDIVVNNAGIIRRAPIGDITPEALHAVLKVNLTGAVFVTQAAWQHLVSQQYGRIINATSSAGLLGNVGSTSYASSKAGILGLTRVWALEGAEHGIRVNAIAPLALTRMTESLAETGWLPKNLTADQVAPVVTWLAHEDCDVTGECYSAGGGRVARYFTGLTEGYFTEGLTPEHVRDNLDTIRRRDGYTVPLSPEGEFEVLIRQSKAHEQSLA
jgi:NAD(P)-dependent dehydrogenase (short-subunit alcohol dehydrogenase family)